jgi:hypothetical protein
MTATLHPSTLHPSPGAARRGLAAVAGALALAFAATTAARAEDPAIQHRRSAEQKTFTDAQIIDGFFRVTFGAEFHTEGRTDRIRKFDEPVRVHVVNRAAPDRSRQIGEIVADISRRVQQLDIALTSDPDAANLVVTLVNDRDLTKTIRSQYGRARARSIQRSLEPQCLSGFRKDETFRILQSSVILVADAGDFVFYDCAYEELLQALGPINDDHEVPWTMFNDDVRMGFFDVYDQYLMNILYDRRVRPGMTRAEVFALVPQILPAVRAFVARVNELKGD